eukprot:1705870-Pleurochrysis_carterae.AAC.1
MADIAPHLALLQPEVAVQPASTEMATLALDAATQTAKPSSAPLVSAVTNFYMTDAVSRASTTMAKCTQVFGTRV